MKRIICLLLSLIMAFGCVMLIASCGDDTCTAHVDADKNGKCDNCDAAVDCTKCEDADKNGKCDVCGKDVEPEACTECKDENNDGKCDACGEDVESEACTECKDENGDGKCDACGEDVEADEVKVLTYAEYAAAELDTVVTIEAYVQAKQGWWENKAVLYLQDEDGAYFVYNLPISEEDYNKLVDGQKIRVTGKKIAYRGEVEISDAEATYEILEGNWKASAFDITDILGTDDLINHQNKFVSFNGLTVVPCEDAEGNELPWMYNWNGAGDEGSDLYFNVTDGEKVYSFTVESYLCGTDSDVYKAVKTLQVGDVINAEGFLYWYDTVNPHITSVDVIGHVMTYAEYAAAELDTVCTIEAYVQAKQNWWENKAVLYLQDEDGAYFVYNLPISEEDYNKLVYGQKIRVTGKKIAYRGEVEISDAEATFDILKGNWKAPAFDITDLLGTDDLINHQNKFVSFKGLTVVPCEDADGNELPWMYNWNGAGDEGSDLYFNVTDGEKVYSFTVESYLCGTDSDVYKAVKTLKIGDVINAEGFLYWYDTVNPHITSVDVLDHVMTYAEYAAAELDTVCTIEAYVQAKQNWWSNKAVLYLQDEDGAYFVYNLPISEEDYNKLVDGQKIKVTGKKVSYRGEIEISDAEATYEILDGNWIAPATDVTELLGTEDLINHQNKFVSFKGLTVVASEDADGNELPWMYGWNGAGDEGNDLYFSVSDGENVYSFTVESYLCGTDSDVYKAVKTLKIGDVIDAEGFLYWYDTVNPHITSVSVVAE